MWNRNRTTLIPKPGKENSKIENYRPITIGSTLCRLYWGIMDNRLRDRTSFSQRQKCFVYESECFNNDHMFNEFLNSAKTNKGITIIQLDITKAFDTITHAIIHPSLSRLGLPREIISICKSYEHVSTTIGHKESKVEILQRGVKQRVPLSPFLFNAAMDPSSNWRI